MVLLHKVTRFVDYIVLYGGNMYVLRWMIVVIESQLCDHVSSL
jgi:hypothetical protein